MRKGNVIAVAVAVGVVCAFAVSFERPAVVAFTDVTAPSYRTPTPKDRFTPRSGQPTPVGPPDLGFMGSGLRTLTEVVAGVVLVVALCWLAIAVLRALRNRRRRTQTVPTTLDAPLEAVVAEGVDRALDDLSIGSPDNAIIRCWVALQSAARDAGIEPRESETSAELTIRLLNDLRVQRDAVARLAALYREARFSSHPLEESAREAAREALTAIRHDLGAEVVHD